MSKKDPNNKISQEGDRTEVDIMSKGLAPTQIIRINGKDVKIYPQRNPPGVFDNGKKGNI